MALIVATAADLQSERGAGDKVWGSMIKQTLKRRRPGFSESYYERSGGYVVHRINNNS